MSKATPSSKDFVEVADIRDDIVVLKNGSLRTIIEAGSVNFELKSVDEQTGLIQAFQAFINALDFSVEIMLSSRRIDIRPYLASLEALQGTAANELLRIQITEYTKFVKGLIELANIMTKKFYISVPFSAVESASAAERGKGLVSGIKSMFGAGNGSAAVISDSELESYKVQLNQRVDVITSGIGGMGIDARVVRGDELTKLLYAFYNPGHIL